MMKYNVVSNSQLLEHIATMYKLHVYTLYMIELNTEYRILLHVCPAGSMHHELHVYYNIHGLGGQDSLKGVKLSQCPPPLNILYSQSLSQWSKTRTSIADPGSASGGTFQCMQFLPFLSIFLTCSI